MRARSLCSHQDPLCVNGAWNVARRATANRRAHVRVSACLCITAAHTVAQALAALQPVVSGNSYSGAGAVGFADRAQCAQPA